jgi:hypothetical protein
MEHNKFIKLMNISLLALGIELIVFLYTDFVCMNANNYHILSIWQNLLLGKYPNMHHQTLIIYMIWLMTHITTDIYLSRLDLSSIGGTHCPEE